MRKKLIGSFCGVFLALQYFTAQANNFITDNQEVDLKKQLILLLKKYEKFNLTEEHLTRKIMADLAAQTKAYQWDTVEDEELNKSDLKNNLLIAGMIVGCGLLAYFIYVIFLKHNPLQDIVYTTTEYMDDGGRHYSGMDQNRNQRYSFYARVKNGFFELDTSRHFTGHLSIIKAVLEEENR